MHCPRCGMDNDDSRVACWSCFAQLKPPVDGKPQKIDIRKQEEKKAKLASPPEPASVDVTTLVSSTTELRDQLPAGASDIEQTMPESAILADAGPEPYEQSPLEPTLKSSSADAPVAGTESTEVEPVFELDSFEPTEYSAAGDQLPIDEGNSAAWDTTFELGEVDATVSPSDLIVSGLAYSQPEGEEELPFDIGEDAQDVGEGDSQASSDDGDGKPAETA